MRQTRGAQLPVRFPPYCGWPFNVVASHVNPHRSLLNVIKTAGLIVSIVVVWVTYRTVVVPNADQFVAKQTQAGVKDMPFNWWVVLKDYEQEACMMLFLWSLVLLGIKYWEVTQERAVFRAKLIEGDDHTRIIPADARDYLRRLDKLTPNQRELLLPRTLDRSLSRFTSAKTTDEVANAVTSNCESEIARLDSELGIIRFIAWAVPSIGFIGTVRGIGAALGKADAALKGDLYAVTSNLGVAFNSTLIALFISIAMMLLIHKLQTMQEGLVFDVERHAQKHLISRLHFPDTE